MYIYLCVSNAIYLYLPICIYQSISLSISIYLSMYLSIKIYICRSIYLYLSISICLSVSNASGTTFLSSTARTARYLDVTYTSIYLLISIYLSICVYVCIYIYLSIFLPTVSGRACLSSLCHGSGTSFLSSTARTARYLPSQGGPVLARDGPCVCKAHRLVYHSTQGSMTF